MMKTRWLKRRMSKNKSWLRGWRSKLEAGQGSLRNTGASIRARHGDFASCPDDSDTLKGLLLLLTAEDIPDERPEGQSANGRRKLIWCTTGRTLEEFMEFYGSKAGQTAGKCTSDSSWRRELYETSPDFVPEQANIDTSRFYDTATVSSSYYNNVRTWFHVSMNTNMAADNHLGAGGAFEPCIQR